MGYLLSDAKFQMGHYLSVVNIGRLSIALISYG